VARGMAAASFEAGIKSRVVISEFDSLEKAIAAHDCPAYKDAVKVLGDGAERDVRIVEGLE
jgi:uncharacterized protein (DUF1330 family)